MSVEQRLREMHHVQDPSGLIDLLPYANYLGMQCLCTGEALHFALPASDHLIGNPTLPAIHGGVIGGFMEAAATLHLVWHGQHTPMPKVIDFSLDYLRPGRQQTTFARCHVVRQGRKIVNVSINAWQHDEEQPIATARTHFLLAHESV